MPLNRVLLFVTARDRAQTSQLLESLRVGAERALKALHLDGSDAHVLVELDDAGTGADDYGRIQRDGLRNGVHLGGLDAVVELTGPGPRGLAALAGCLEEVRDFAGHAIDNSLSSVVAGTDVVVVEGTGPVRLVYGLRRKSGTSHADFLHYWKKRHANVTRITPGVVGYRQLHGDPGLSRRAAEAAGVGLHDIDGVALHWYRSVQDFVSMVDLVGPIVPSATAPVTFNDQAVSSERRFTDLGGTRAIVATEL